MTRGARVRVPRGVLFDCCIMGQLVATQIQEVVYLAATRLG